MESDTGETTLVMKPIFSFQPDPVTPLVAAGGIAGVLSAKQILLMTTSLNLGGKSLQSKLLNEKLTAKKSVSTIAGSQLDMFLPGAGYSIEPVTSVLLEKAMDSMEKDILETTPSSGAFIEQPNKVREEIQLERPDLKEVQ